MLSRFGTVVTHTDNKLASNRRVESDALARLTRTRWVARMEPG